MKGSFVIVSVATLFCLITFFFFFQGCATFGWPSTFVRTHSEPGIWRSIETREELSKDAKWRIAVDALSIRFDIEVIDKESGYIRTSWKYTLTSRGGAVDDRYRSRIILKMIGDTWNVVNVKCEANWLDPSQGWIIGYDTAILDEVYGDLIGRFSRVSK